MNFYGLLRFNFKKRWAKSIEKKNKFHGCRLTSHYCLFRLYASEFQEAIRTKQDFTFKFQQ